MISHKAIKLSVIEVMGYTEKYLPCGHISINWVPVDESELIECCGFKLWRLNNLYTVVNKEMESVPFKLKHVQLKLYLNLHGLDVIPKSRQHGISTLFCLDYLDDALFISDMAVGIIALTQPTATRLFATKIKYALDHLPDYIKEKVETTGFTQSSVTFANGSSVRVATTYQGDTIGRLHISEYGPICTKRPLQGESIRTDTLPAVHPHLGGKVTIESTADGPSGPFYDLCVKARAATELSRVSGVPLGIKQYKNHFFGFQEDPENVVVPTGVSIPEDLQAYFARKEASLNMKLSDGQKEWYYWTKEGPEGKKIKQQHAMDFDEAFEQALEGAVYEEEMTLAHDEGRVCLIPYVKNAPVYTFWDLGISKGNATCVLFVQFIDDFINVIDYYEVENRGMTHIAGEILKKDYNYPSGPFCYGPHDIVNRDKGTGLPLMDIARDCGLRFKKTPRPKNKERDGIESVRTIFNKLRFNIDKCDRLIKGLKCYRYEYNEEMAQWGKAPVHDWASNPADATQTLGLAYKYCTFSNQYLGDVSLMGRIHHSQTSDFQRSESYNWHGR